MRFTNQLSILREIYNSRPLPAAQVWCRTQEGVEHYSMSTLRHAQGCTVPNTGSGAVKLAGTTSGALPPPASTSFGCSDTMLRNNLCLHISGEVALDKSLQNSCVGPVCGEGYCAPSAVICQLGMEGCGQHVHAACSNDNVLSPRAFPFIV